MLTAPSVAIPVGRSFRMKVTISRCIRGFSEIVRQKCLVWTATRAFEITENESLQRKHVHCSIDSKNRSVRIANVKVFVSAKHEL